MSCRNVADAMCVVSKLENMIIRYGKNEVQKYLKYECETGLAMNKSQASFSALC